MVGFGWEAQGEDPDGIRTLITRGTRGLACARARSLSASGGHREKAAVYKLGR